MTAPDVIISNLTVTYRRGQVRALDGIDVRFPGGMVGLLGPNGAGKTTLMRVLAGVLHPTTGTVTVGGVDLAAPDGRRQVKSVSGYLPQELGLYPDLTARQFLDYMGLLKGIDGRAARRERIEQVLDLVALREAAGRKLKTYSGGMKRRAGIAQAILNDPRFLIVDEPTAGLDPEERLRFRSLLVTLAGDRTVLLSTHIVEDIVQTCPHVVVVKHGTIAFQGPTSLLAGLAAGMTWHLTCPPGAPAPDLPTVSVSPVPDGTRYRVISVAPPGRGAEPVEATAEDGYLALMHATQTPPDSQPLKTASHPGTTAP
jgi:ABC-2 type transport system ATP-binding protein